MNCFFSWSDQFRVFRKSFLFCLRVLLIGLFVFQQIPLRNAEAGTGNQQIQSANSSPSVVSRFNQPEVSSSSALLPFFSVNPKPLAAPLIWTLFNGTASTSTSVRALAVYNGALYASSSSTTQTDGRVYRYDGTNWVDLDFSGKLGVPVNMVESFQVFNGLLYIGVRVSENNLCYARIYRYDGSNFSMDFSDDGLCNMSGISDMTIHNNTLYAANGSRNGKVYQRVADNNWVLVGSALGQNDSARTLTSFQGDLYLGTGSQYGKIWKWSGSAWTLVKDLYPDYHINGVWKILPYKNKLFVSAAGAVNPSPIISFDGSTWTLSKSITNSNYNRLALVNNKLWAVAGTGQIFMTEDGVTWSAMGSAGTGNVYDLAQYGNYVYAVTDYGGRIYRAGSTLNTTISGQVTNGEGIGIPDVNVSDGAGHTVRTDYSGNYSFSGVGIGSYTITPARIGYTFTPSNQSVEVTTPDPVKINFSGSNPLLVTHIEITQATQDDTNSVTLIANKQTYARVYVDCGPGCNKNRMVTGTLRAYRIVNGTITQIGDPIWPSYNRLYPEDKPWTDQRGDITKSLNFILPQDWTTGSVRFVAEVDGVILKTDYLPFSEAPEITIYYVPVNYLGQVPDQKRINKAIEFTRSVYPTNNVKYIKLPSWTWNSAMDFCSSQLWVTYQNCMLRDLLIQLNGLYRDNQLSGDTTFLFGWLPDIALYDVGYVGYADMKRLLFVGGKVAIGVDELYDGPNNELLSINGPLLTHETAHLMGRHHPNIKDCSGTIVDETSDWPEEYHSSKIQQWGFDGSALASDFKNTPKDPQATWDYMTYCVFEPHVWTSPWTYSHILSYIQQNAAAQSEISKQSEPAPYYTVSGMISSTDSAFFYPITSEMTSDPIANPPTGTEYCLNVEDGSANVLTQSCFDLSFINPETGELDGVEPFEIMLPYPDGAARFVLKKGEVELASQVVSANSPEVTITSPNGSDTWDASGDYTITWNASDLDGDPLLFTVSYSSDGNQWSPLAYNQTETSLTVNAADLPGSDNALIRVTATDGVNTTSDESDLPFSISRKGPQPIIASPSISDTTVGSGQLLLQGSAYDLEDGPLADSSLTWSSSIDGALGTGSNLLVNLTPGSHTITLTAVDADANSATSEVTINVNTCYALQLGHTGDGSDPVASPAYSEICPTGMYVAGESIQLSGAQPAVAFLLTGWTGTADDSSTATTNSLVMPAADTEVSVNYTPDTNTYSISGTVKTSSGSGVNGVAIDDGSGHSILTDEDGNFTLSNLSAGNITLTPQKDGRAFTPSSRSTVLGPDASGFDFVQNNKTPVITELVPAYLYKSNTPATLTISGSDFGSDSVVRLAGVDQATTYIDSAHLSISLTPSDAADLGKVDVTVFNPASEGGLSNQLSLPILAFSPLVDQKLASSKVSFAWGAIPDATGYTLQLSLNSSFSTTLVNTATTSPNYSYGTALTNAKTYYWRVRPKYGTVLGDWSPSWSFFSKNPPAAPTLVLPASAAYLNDNTPTVSWNSVSNGNKYHLQISKSSSFGVLERDLALDAGILEATITPLADGLYYWRVQAIDSVDVVGAWSLVRSFTIDTLPPSAPVLSAPLAGVTVKGTPLYKWSAPVGAKKYQFLYGANLDCSSPAFVSPMLTTTSFTPPTQPVGSHTWCVKAFDAAGNESPLSIPRSLTIQPLIPVGPGLVSPASSALTNDSTPTLSWNPVPYGVRYRILVSRSSSFPSTSILQTIETDGELTADLSMLPDGKYYWRVQAQNIDLVWGSWSSYRAFTIDTLPPTIPAMTSPLNSSSVLTPTPKLVVASAAGAKYYRFQVNTSNAFSDPLVDVKGTAIYYTLLPAQALPFGSAWWRVKTIDAAGNESDWSSPTQFTVTILKAPASGSYTLKTKPVFTWASVSGAKQYQLQVDDDADFSSPIDTITRPPSTTFTLLTALENGKYYWRMQVDKGAGFTGNWTPAYGFTVTPPLPTAPQLVSPASGYISSSMPALTWNAVSGSIAAINGYEYQISKSSAFTTLERSGIVDVLTYTPSGLSLGKYYWRVRAINDLDVPGPWASYRSFTLIP